MTKTASSVENMKIEHPQTGTTTNRAIPGSETYGWIVIWGNQDLSATPDKYKVFLGGSQLPDAYVRELRLNTPMPNPPYFALEVRLDSPNFSAQFQVKAYDSGGTEIGYSDITTGVEIKRN